VVTLQAQLWMVSRGDGGKREGSCRVTCPFEDIRLSARSLLRFTTFLALDCLVIFVLDVFRSMISRIGRFDLQSECYCERVSDVWGKARRAFGPQRETALRGRSQLRYPSCQEHSDASADYRYPEH
jgi:hypothetical protein